MRDITDILFVHPEVESALADRRAVVALESTVITHGLPHPQNVETALQMEATVREYGAVPATIAVLQGRVHVGVEQTQLEHLAALPSGQVRKCSRRDLPIAIARADYGGTTVAGTMLVAHLAGIRLFATGGIGGVHRGHPFDVSADLTELGRTPVAVVCSGAKSILDLALTREVLETNGVPVLGYKTEDFPAFFTRTSGYSVDVRVESAAEAAGAIAARDRLGLQSGILITVPVPEQAECPDEVAEAATVQATQEADAKGISGAAATPWLLQRVAELSGGKTLRANLALLYNNARVAAEVAVELAQL